jgi:hypothetical protein
MVVPLPFLMQIFVELWLKRFCEANRWVGNHEWLDERFVLSHTLCRGLASPTICVVLIHVMKSEIYHVMQCKVR